MAAHHRWISFLHSCGIPQSLPFYCHTATLDKSFTHIHTKHCKLIPAKTSHAVNLWNLTNSSDSLLLGLWLTSPISSLPSKPEISSTSYNMEVLFLHHSASVRLVGMDKNFSYPLLFVGILQWSESTGVLCSKPWPPCRHWRHHARVHATTFQVDLWRRSRVQVLFSREKWSVSRTRWTDIIKLMTTLLLTHVINIIKIIRINTQNVREWANVFLVPVCLDCLG